MSPIQQMLLGVGAVAKKTYVDDVFSTYIYNGTGSAQTINNGINLSGEGGMVWIKQRGNATAHVIGDSLRGDNKYLASNSGNGQGTNNTRFKTLTTTGFEVGGDNDTGGSSNNYSSWSFRKAPGFFTIKEYTGSGSTQSISHDLGSIPGCIMVKRTDTLSDWGVYHRGQNGGVDPEDYRLKLNSTTTQNNDTYWGDTAPTATHFTVGDSHTEVNNSSGTYIAYIFAGGESTAATARSVDFHSGDSEYLSIASDAAFQLGTGDFTVEFWWKGGEGSGNYQQVIGTQSIFAGDAGIWRIGTKTNVNRVYFSSPSGSGFDEPEWDVNVNDNQWHHIAITRDSGYVYCYIDGIKRANVGDSNNITRSLTTNNSLYIARNGRDGSYIDGQLSNVRIVKGTAVYTSSFKPPTEPLTNITNTKLLCCNNSSTTGSTVTPGTITANGDPTALSDSPFDDPAGFAFGDSKEGIIKCGSYVGNGSNTGPEVNLGWEPQWLMVKRTDSGDKWPIYDSMRGIVTGGNDARLYANENNSEYTSNDYFELTPTGFKITKSSGEVNGNGGTYVYICIRRPDGYVGKPPELGTDVFAMDTGSGSDTIPNFDSGFPVDWGWYRNPSTASSMWVPLRLTGPVEMKTSGNNAESSYASAVFDSNVGWSKSQSNNNTQSWMWKRHAGFDVVNYVGNQTSGHHIAHSLGQTPEMVWTKNRDQVQQWSVGHKDLNGGTNPWGYYLALSASPNEKEDASSNFWEAPTATHFTVGSDARVNKNNFNYLAILFSSVNGISKVGSFTGSSSALTITTGFQPRFIIIKNASSNSYDDSTDWFVFDTTRGWASGNNDKLLLLNDNDAQTTEDWTNPTSTGFTINADSGNHLNNDGDRYIYYAHA